MRNSVLIYKNKMSEEDRLESLDMFLKYPNSILSGSLCTDEPVYQLREFLPNLTAKKIFQLHTNMMPIIAQDFGLSLEGIELVTPRYMDPESNEFLTVDKRIAGMKLPIHRDIPTGTYTNHHGLDDGKTAITMTGIFYWNDDFVGGELKFDDELLIDPNDSSSSRTILYKPVAGDFVVFPSYLYHEILPIIEGERYSTQYFFNRTKQYHVTELPNYEVNYLQK